MLFLNLSRSASAAAFAEIRNEYDWYIPEGTQDTEMLKQCRSYLKENCVVLHGREIPAGLSLDGHFRRQLNVSLDTERLRVVVLFPELVIDELVGAVHREVIVEVDAPRHVRVGVVQPASGNIFTGDRVVVYSSVIVRSVAGIAAAALRAVVALDGSFARQ